LKTKFVRGAQIIRYQIFIYLDGSRHTRLNANVHFNVAAMNSLAHQLPQPKLVQIEIFGQTHLQIEEAVVHTFDADA
jgi:hypothetical protein